MSRIVVVGGALAGIAAAARLAKVGHDVVLVEGSSALGGRLAEPGLWPPVLGFPAPLRDLLRKSGRAFDAEFATRGLRMVPAPPAHHVFADDAFDWPTDRAAQWHLLHDRYSPVVASRWRDLLDAHDETWQILRPLGLEAELIDRTQVDFRRRFLAPHLTVEDAARHLNHPHLSHLVRDVARRIGSDPDQTPSWLLARLSVERTFGRWMLTDDEGLVHQASEILTVLAARLATRGVQVLTDRPVTAIRSGRVSTADGDLRADAVISTVNPWEHARLTNGGGLRQRQALRRLTPALAPTVTRCETGERASAPLTEEVRHTPAGPVVTIRRRTPTGTEIVEYDYTRRLPAPGYGVRWHGPGTWLRMPGLRTPGDERLLTASAGSRGGNEPWAQLLSGALAVYAVHRLLTGEDIRPSNRDYKP